MLEIKIFGCKQLFILLRYLKLMPPSGTYQYHVARDFSSTALQAE